MPWLTPELGEGQHHESSTIESFSDTCSISCLHNCSSCGDSKKRHQRQSPAQSTAHRGTSPPALLAHRKALTYFPTQPPAVTNVAAVFYNQEKIIDFFPFV